MKLYLDNSDQLLSDSVAYPILESPSPILIDQISTDQALHSEDSNENDKIIGESVSIKDWYKLFSLGIGNFWFAVAIILGALNSLLYLLMYYVLGEWSKIDNSNQKNGALFYYYISIIIGSTLLICVNCFVVVYVYYSSSKTLHNKMIWKLLRAPLSFLDSNSIGNILTRFSHDIQGLDDFMPTITFVQIRYITQVAASCIAMIIAVPFMLIIIILFCIFLVLIYRRTVSVSQNIEFLESKYVEPINTKFGSIIDGLLTVRAYKKQQYFLNGYIEDSNKYKNYVESNLN